MQVLHERCCGLDVHKKTVVACVLSGRRRETRTYGTMTPDLEQLARWLEAEQVTHVVMESTGVYWKPIYNVLEGRSFELLVVNARSVKAVPGRKTDVKDAEWLAELLRHGLVRASYIPEREQRELRELVRYRRVLIQERSQHVTRIAKLLEGANIKLGDVASSVVGKSARAMLKQLIAGNRDVEAIAELAESSLRTKRQELARALTGTFGPHQAFMLESQLSLVESYEAEIDILSAQIEERMHPFDPAIELIDAVPGIGREGAEQILAETGIDMSRFPTVDHFVSWARVCPGNNESAGKRRTGSTGGGNHWLRSALIEASLGAVRAGRKNPNFFSARYIRIAARRGSKRAAMAVAHSILVAIYHMLRDGTQYQDLGATHWDSRHREAVARRAVERLERLGYKVAIEGAA